MIKRIIIEVEKVENGYSIIVDKRQPGLKGFFSFPSNRNYVAENLDSLKKLLEQVLGEFEKTEEIK